ncbi:Uncharacterised protein [Shigella sonnei]|nr:Uncharacterised protein [Shigella sonnei]
MSKLIRVHNGRSLQIASVFFLLPDHVLCHELNWLSVFYALRRFVSTFSLNLCSA